MASDEFAKLMTDNSDSLSDFSQTGLYEFSQLMAEMAQLSLDRNDALRSRAFVQRLLELGRPDARTLLLAYRTEMALKDPRAAQRYGDQLKRDFPDSEQAKELGGK